MKHQKIGDIVPIGADIYMIEKLEEGWVYLRQPNARGKSKKIYWREVPYFEDGKLIIPEIKKLPTFNSKIHLGSFFKKNSELQVSKEFIAFAYEHIESLLHSLLELAHDNAISREEKRLMPAHWYILNLKPQEGNGYWKEQNEYAIKESVWLHVDEERRESKENV